MRFGEDQRTNKHHKKHMFKGDWPMSADFNLKTTPHSIVNTFRRTYVSVKESTDMCLR